MFCYSSGEIAICGLRNVYENATPCELLVHDPGLETILAFWRTANYVPRSFRTKLTDGKVNPYICQSDVSLCCAHIPRG